MFFLWLVLLGLYEIEKRKRRENIQKNNQTDRKIDYDQK